MQYLGGFAVAIFRHGMVWWITLILAYFFGLGIFEDWPKVRAVFMSWTHLDLPEQIPLWWVVLPLMTWLVVALAHREAMRRLYAGRVVFEEPQLLPDVPLYVSGRGQVGAIDIAYINVRNVPYDSISGKAIEHVYGSVSIYDAKWKHIKSVDYLRWTEGQKLGYQGSPTDHFPHE
jgi:hypothetical protein